MLKINSLNDTQTLNYRAHVLESHMYTGKLKFEFLTFIDQDYINHCNKQAKIGFKQNKERDMAIAALILGTGIRVSECAGVDLSDLNLKDAVLDVTRKGGQKIVYQLQNGHFLISSDIKVSVMNAIMQIVSK